jgi:hypothetical protein
MLCVRWYAALALLCAQAGLVLAFGPRRQLAPAPKLAAAARAEALCLRGGGEVATPIDDDEDDDDIDDGDEDDMEDEDDGDDGDDDGDDGDDDDDADEEAVEESASDLDTGALKRLMIMGTITVAMHLFLPKVPDAPAEEAASQDEEPAAEEAAPSDEEAAEYVEEEEVEVYEDEVAEEEAATA